MCVAAKSDWMGKQSSSQVPTPELAKKLQSIWLKEVSHLRGFFSKKFWMNINNCVICVSGARVIMACRDMDRANKAAEDVRKRSGNGNVVVKKLDLASLESVRQLSKEVLASEERLDILINNAGRRGNLHLFNSD